MSKSDLVQGADLPAAVDDEGVYHVPVSGEVPPSETIPAVVATIEETDPAELDLLYHAVDPSALNALFQCRADGTPRSNGSIAFEYAGYEIVYETNSQLRIRPISNGR